MIQRTMVERLLLILWACGVFLVALFSSSPAQAQLKKVRIGSSSTNVSFLAIYAAYHRGFYKDEGIDLEIIFMPANLASTAVLAGDVDYNGQ